MLTNNVILNSTKLTAHDKCYKKLFVCEPDYTGRSLFLSAVSEDNSIENKFSRRYFVLHSVCVTFHSGCKLLQ